MLEQSGVHGVYVLQEGSFEDPPVGELHAAVELDRAAAQMGVGEPEEYASYVTRLGALLDDRVREAAWAEGRRMTADQLLGEMHG